MKSWRTNLNCIKIFPPPRVDPPLICDVEDLHLHRSIKCRVRHNQLLDLCTRSQQLVVGAENEGGMRTFFRDPSLMDLKRSELRQSGFENDCWMWFCVARSHAQLSNKVPPKDVSETMTATSLRWRGAEELAGCETKCELSEVSELSQPPSHTKCSRCNFGYKARLDDVTKDKHLRNFFASSNSERPTITKIEWHSFSILVKRPFLKN